MKNAKNGDSKKTIKKKKKTRIIDLDKKNQLMTDIEYEKYYNRIRLLSRGL
jgi:hypothetical protein